MTEVVTAGLRAPTTRVLIVANSVYAPQSGLASHPAIRRSAEALTVALTDACGLDPAQITVRTDLDTAGLREALTVTAAATPYGGLLLVYFLGHGLVDPTTLDLFLAGRDTHGPADTSGATSVQYAELSRIAHRHGAGSTAIVLDCCYSAQAAAHLAGPGRSAFASSVHRGQYLLAASSRQAFVMAGDTDLTCFTGTLVRLLTDGDDRLPPTLTLEDCYRHLERVLDTSPHRYAVDRLGEIEVCLNARFQQPVVPEPRPPEPDVVCPYPGLSAFRTTEARFFHGRDALVERMLEQLAVGAREGRPLVVVGPSGVGKSSLVRAGLIPRLEFAPREAWHGGGVRFLSFSPDVDPLRALARALAGQRDERIQEIISRLRADPHSIIGIVADVHREFARDPGDGPPRVAIFVDQFEELFVYPVRPGQGADHGVFVRALCAAAARGPDGSAAALVVLAVRGDYFARCTQFSELLPTLQDVHLVVAPPSMAELTEMIVKPALDVGMAIEPGLSQRLLTDLRTGAPSNDDTLPASPGHDPAGSLPLLAYALLLTFNNRRGRYLTLDAYQATGGIWTAVATTAEDVYDRLGSVPQGQAALRRLLLGMVHIGNIADDSRRTVNLADASFGDVDRATIAQVAEYLATARLITVDADRAVLTHEAVIRSWPRLQSWINADRAGLYTRQQLIDASVAWRDSDRDDGYVYRGARLDQAATLAQDPRWADELPYLAVDFLRASQEARRDDERIARRTRLLISVIVVIILGAVAAVAGIFYRQKTAADHARDIAISESAANAAEVLRNAEIPESKLLALSAWHVNDNVTTRSALIDTFSSLITNDVLQVRGQYLSAAQMSPVAPVLALGSKTQASDHSAGAVTLWNVADPVDPVQIPVTLRGPNAGVQGLTFSPDGRTLAASADEANGGLWIWHLDGSTSGVITGVRLAVGYTQFATPSFSSDGTLLAAGELDPQVGLPYVWSLDSAASGPIEIGKPAPGTYGDYDLAFKPGTHVLYGQPVDGSLWTWDIATPHADPTRVLPSTEGISTFAFDRTGTRMLTGTRDGNVQEWNTATSRPTVVGAQFTTATSPVSEIAFNHDSTEFATVAGDDTVRLWATDSHRPGQTLQLNAPVITTSFGSDDKSIVTLDSDTNAQLWKLPGAVVTDTSPDLFSIAAHGNLMAAGGADGEVRLWRVTTSHAFESIARPISIELDGAARIVTAVALSADGTQLAAGDFEGDLFLWDISDPSVPKPLVTAFHAYQPQEITSLSYVADRKEIVASSADGSVYLYETSHPTSHPSGYDTGPTDRSVVHDVAASPSGRLMAYSTRHGVELVDITDMGRIRNLGFLGLPRDVGDQWVQIAFSPDGRLMATMGALHGNHVGALFSLADPLNPKFLEYLSGPASYGITGIAFSPDGRQIAADDYDHDVWIWDLRDPSAPTVLATLTGHTRVPVAIAYVSNDVLATGGQDSVIRLWDPDIADVTAEICASQTPQRFFDASQWNRWLAPLKYRPPCA